MTLGKNEGIAPPRGNGSCNFLQGAAQLKLGRQRVLARKWAFGSEQAFARERREVKLEVKGGRKQAAQPIGVFDSGVGGLTVLKAIKKLLPMEDFIYLGDTARLPYGTKSPQSITRYALQSALHLVARRIKLLVVACNTASAVALEELEKAFQPTPIIGVIKPGAAASSQASASGRICVVATESTVRQGAYETEIKRIRPEAAVVSIPCPLFVALAEEGWVDGPLVEGIIERYLRPAFFAADSFKPDCLVLGCTHFPVLAKSIRKVLGPAIVLVDSAETTAAAVERELATRGLRRDRSGDRGNVTFLATDGAERFARVGSLFLGEPLSPLAVEIVDL